jgi:hypothetical protein
MRHGYDAYVEENRKLDALTEAMKLVMDEFDRTRDPEAAAAGHVLAGMIKKKLEAMDAEIDRAMEQAGV